MGGSLNKTQKKEETRKYKMGIASSNTRTSVGIKKGARNWAGNRNKWPITTDVDDIAPPEDLANAERKEVVKMSVEKPGT